MLAFPIIIILSIDIRGGSLAAYSMFLGFFKEIEAEKQTKRVFHACVPNIGYRI